MDTYDSYQRPVSRDTRDRDEYRSGDAYRERRRSPERRRERRPRSRSPAPAGRRSRSPAAAAIDRYQPDRVPRNDHYRRDDYRERRRSPQPASIDRYVPGMDQPALPLAVNPLPDPMSLDYQVGFTWFAEWWRAEQRIKEEKERQKTGRPPPRLRGEREAREDREGERPKIQAAYDEYKANLQKAQAQAFVRVHKSEDWFRERYVPEVRDPFRSRLMEYRRGLFAQWEQDLTGGTFDEFTLEGIYKAEANGQGGVVEKEEGETTAAAEVLGVGDLLPSKGGDIRNPSAQQPTLLVKTIAPTVSREKFEEFAKEHLGEGEAGFRHLSLSDPNPQKKCHRMGWILLNPEQDNGDEDADKLEFEQGEEGVVDEKPITTSSKALEKINAKTIEDGERGFTVYCGVHRPPELPRKKALWDLFSAPERVNRDLALVTRLVRKLDNEMGDEYFGVAKVEERVQDLAEKGHLQPVAPSKPENLDADMDQDGPEEEGMVEEDENDDQELLMRKKKLDLLVEYLRRVYNFCFFCVFESDSVHEMQRKCPGGHLRRPRGSLTSAAKEVARASAEGEPFPLKKNGESKSAANNADAAPDAMADEDGELEPDSPTEERRAPIHKPNHRNASQLQRAYNWVRTFEEKILQILEPEKVNIRKLGGVPVEEGLEEELNKFVKQEDHSKYRCKVPDCTKLFKSTEFWRKHVEKRHTEWYERQRAEIDLVNTYVLDPAHIAPSRSDANSNGHFPVGQNLPAGTPRGFSLGQHQSFPMGFPMAAGVPGNAMPGMMYGLPPGFPAPIAGLPGMTGGVGPMRGHGGRNGRMGGYGAGMPHPYMRPDGRGGRPPMGRPGVGPSGGEGGSIGPNEAVAGRSLRSYEDLDAAGGGDDGVAAAMDY